LHPVTVSFKNIYIFHSEVSVNFEFRRTREYVLTLGSMKTIDKFE